MCDVFVPGQWDQCHGWWWRAHQQCRGLTWWGQVLAQGWDSNRGLLLGVWSNVWWCFQEPRNVFFFSNKQAIGSGCFPGHVFGSFGSFGAKRVICVYSQPLERWSMDLGGQKTWWLHQKRDVKFLKEAPTYHYNMPKKNASGILNHEIVCLFVCSFYDQRFILSKFLLPQAPTFLTRIFGIDVVCECSLNPMVLLGSVSSKALCFFNDFDTEILISKRTCLILGGEYGLVIFSCCQTSIESSFLKVLQKTLQKWL